MVPWQLRPGMARLTRSSLMVPQALPPARWHEARPSAPQGRLAGLYQTNSRMFHSGPALRVAPAAPARPARACDARPVRACARTRVSASSSRPSRCRMAAEVVVGVGVGRQQACGDRLETPPGLPPVAPNRRGGGRAGHVRAGVLGVELQGLVDLAEGLVNLFLSCCNTYARLRRYSVFLGARRTASRSSRGLPGRPPSRPPSKPARGCCA